MGRRSLGTLVGAYFATAVPALGAPLAAAGEAAPRRCGGAAERDALSALETAGDLRLRSGRRVRVADLRLAETGVGGRSWLASLAGSDVLVRVLGPPDRWGIVPATVALASAGPGEPIDVAEILVGEGWARVDVGERDELCRPDLLRLEQAARGRRLGLWSEGSDPVQADDLGRLRDLAGRFVLVEGRIVSVGERAARTYLNFGRDFARDFSVVIPRRNWSAWKLAGWTAERLRGRTVRVRGTLDLGRAPGMEVLATDMLEVEPDRTGRGP